MSEQQQGPGWWLASDGRWYPPEQAPSVVPSGGWADPGGAQHVAVQPSWGAPPPAPVRHVDGMSTGGKIALVVGGLFGALVLLVVVVTLLGSSDQGPDAVPVTEVVPGSFVHFEDPKGAFAIDVQPAWIGLSLRGDVNGLGARTAPDDPNRAAAIDGAVAAAPRQLVFMALEGEVLGTGRFVPNINIGPVPRQGASIEEIEVSIPHEAETFGARDAQVERVSTSVGEGLRMTYRFDPSGPLAGVEGRQYYLLTEDTVWVLTLTSDDMAIDEEHFDASASSFTLR